LAIGAEHRSLHDAGHEVTGAPPVEVAMHASAEPPSRDPGRARSVMVVSVGIYTAVTWRSRTSVSSPPERGVIATYSGGLEFRRPSGRVVAGLGRQQPNV
jgi:hypothetical protein